MRTFASVGTLAACASVGMLAGQSQAAVTDDYAFRSMVANIGSYSANTAVPNVQAGAVIASPSTAGPDYFYSWIRDGALTTKVVIDNFIRGQRGVTRSILETMARAEYKHQQNAASSSASLGEPKFNPDGSLFTGPWGRPQNDGPAIRATAWIKYARKIGLQDSFTTGLLYKPDLSGNSLIKNDLEYVAHHWQDSNFDLWEEVNAQHFFTLAVQRRGLLDGAAFARDMQDPNAAAYYEQQAAAIKNKLQSFWSPSLNRVQAYQGVNRNGIDCSVLLGSLHTFNQTSPAAGIDNTQFGPASDRILATQKQYVDAFRGLYPINNNAAAPQAVATGRYPSDVYDGNGTSEGNPWFLCTLASAEILNDAVYTFNAAGALTVTNVSQPFFQQFQSGVAQGKYAVGSSTYNSLTSGMKAQAAGFVNIVNTHAQTNGSMNEEINRYTGYNTGARDLTWNYAAWLTNSAAAAGSPVF